MKNKQTNFAPAEYGERRVLAARNTPQTAEAIIQRIETPLSGLGRVRKAARRKERVQFNNLLHHITPDLLREAYMNLNRQAVSGLDEESWKGYGEQGFFEHLSRLHTQIQQGRYQPQPSKRVWISKPDGNERAIGIRAVEDKIVEQALVWVFEAIYEEDFLGFSYGFRPERSQHHALDALYVAITCKKVSWVLDANIRGFFDKIDHEWLLRFIGERIADKRVLELCKKMLKAGVDDKGQRLKTEAGIAQGSVISPMFANIVLHYALDQWVNQWRGRHARGEVYIVRYADDFVIAFQYPEDGKHLKRALEQRLGKFGLALHREKTKLIEFGRFAIEDRRKRRAGKPETFTFLGFTHSCGSRKKDGKFMLRRKTNKEKLRKKVKEIVQQAMKKRFERVKDQARWLRSVIVGHFNYYGVPGNRQALDAFRTQVCRAWFRALRRRSQKARKLNWLKMQKLIKAFIPSAKIVHPYPTQRFYV
ncbi:MAG: group II intron reverse transcriptase/maturase [Verrucomicrobia bacterium]|nr:group II intron reverse transcriptase/maturase [Verrucomicrobiota bacterium]